MKRKFVAAAIVMFVFVVVSPVSAQLVAAKDGPIVYGHHHVAASDIAAHKKFWADTLGGTVGKFGTTPRSSSSRMSSSSSATRSRRAARSGPRPITSDSRCRTSAR